MKKIFQDVVLSLRTTHQVLILISLAVLISMFSPQKGIDINNAIADLEKINKLVENWDTRIVENAYRDQIFNPLSEDLYFYNYWKLDLKVEEVSWLGKKDSSTHIIALNAPRDIFLGWPYGYKFGDEGTVTNVLAPKSLEEFSEFWNKARQVARMYISHRSLFKYAYVQKEPGDPIQKVSLDILASDYSYSPEYDGYNGIFKLNIFGANEVDEKDKDLYGLTYLSSDDDEYFAKIWIPSSVNAEAIEYFNATSYVCYLMGINKNERDCDTDFEQVFPDLYYVSKDIRNLPFKNILFELEQKKNNEILNSIDFLGFQFPSLVIFGGGTFILVIIQLYFRLHLNMLVLTISKLEEIPAWIGLFPDWLSRFLSLVTANIIPALLVLFINARSLIDMLGSLQTPVAWEGFARIAMPALIITAQVFIGVYIFFDFLDLWKIMGNHINFSFGTQRNKFRNKRKNRN